MLPSAISSDALFLTFLWKLSLCLIALSVCALSLLICARFFSERRKSRARDSYKNLSAYFYAVLSAPGDLSVEAFPKISTQDRGVVVRIALDLLRTLKGHDAQRIVSLLTIWDMVPYLFVRLKNGIRAEKIRALTLLSHFETDEVHAILRVYAESQDMYVQLAALRGLAWQKRLDDIDLIIAALSRAQRTNRLMLADILCRFGEPIAPALADMATGNADEQVRVAAIMAMGSIKSLHVIPTLVTLTLDESADVRAQAAQALGRIGDVRAGDALLILLEDNSADVRAQAAQALGLIGFDKALPALGMRLSDADWQARFRAAEALHRLGVRGVAVLKSLNGRDDNAGVIAAQVQIGRAHV